jgi:RNA polymerase sigma factor (sigma-70 family)
MTFDSSSQSGSHLSPDVLEKLLGWLDADPARAEARYAQIRNELLKFFADKGCDSIQELADETVLRVVKNLRKPGALAAAPKACFEKASGKVARNYFKRWATTKEAFDRMLRWLDPDVELAGRKYEQIHSVLSTVFRTNGFADAEGLADDTILRVIIKLPEIEKTYSGDPALYFSGVAWRICQESRRRQNLSRKVYGEYDYYQQLRASSQPDLDEESDDPRERCFYKCLQGLKSDDCEMLLTYYRDEKREKINTRKRLAQRLGVTTGNLRVRRYRIYNSLLECIDSCLQEGA